MRALLQRATHGRVTVDGEVVGELDHTPGLVILLGVGPADTEAEVKLLAEKIANLRIFSDADGKFNRSVRDVSGGALVISQFTLYAEMGHGRRPGLGKAAKPDKAEPLVLALMEALRALGVPTQGGRFGAHMQVELTNDGPVTIWLDTDDWRRA